MRRFAPLGLAALLALLLVGARGHGSATCAPGTGSVRFAGRPVVIHVPSAPGRTLLVALHGYRGNGRQMERYTGLNAFADQDHFSVAYPSAAGPFWNANSVPRLPDDGAYIAQLTTYLEQRLCGHPDRVILTGVSNGGGMAVLAACRRPNRFAGLAAVAGGYDGQPPCPAGRALPVLEIHGTADPVAPYLGRSRRRSADGLSPFVHAWLARDRCTGAPQRARLSRRALRLRWTRCAPGGAVEHVRIAGGRHAWPGAHPPDFGPDAGFAASAEIARFLTSLPASRR